MRRVNKSTSFSGHVTEKWDFKLKICPNTIHSFAYNYHCTKFHEKIQDFFAEANGLIFKFKQVKLLLLHLAKD